MEKATDYTNEIKNVLNSPTYKIMKGTAYLMVGSLLIIAGVFVGIIAIEMTAAVIK